MSLGAVSDVHERPTQQFAQQHFNVAFVEGSKADFFSLTLQRTRAERYPLLWRLTASFGCEAKVPLHAAKFEEKNPPEIRSMAWGALYCSVANVTCRR